MSGSAGFLIWFSELKWCVRHLRSLLSCQSWFVLLPLQLSECLALFCAGCDLPFFSFWLAACLKVVLSSAPALKQSRFCSVEFCWCGSALFCGWSQLWRVIFCCFALESQAALQDKVGVPTDLQRLIFEGHQLEERRTVAECNIKNDSFLLLILRLRGGMMIKVKTLTGKEIEIDIKPTDTIRRVKDRVEEK